MRPAARQDGGGGMTSVVAVIGMQWGDEGKGKIVDRLTDRASVVVRFQGDTTPATPSSSVANARFCTWSPPG